MQDTLFSIGKAASTLNVSRDTLRRWDKTGRLPSVRSGKRGHRYYSSSDIEQYMTDISRLGRQWAEALHPEELSPDIYCQTRDIFQSRLELFQSRLIRTQPLPVASLVTAIAGEIGNNSFDHNLGNWPDIPGVYFSYQLRNASVVLSDRGQGILTTLKRARKDLTNHNDALYAAFTQTISGRYLETRGNGLKFVRSIIVGHPFTLYFQTGDAYISLKQHDKEISIKKAKTFLRGCYAIIKFENIV